MSASFGRLGREPRPRFSDADGLKRNGLAGELWRVLPRFPVIDDRLVHNHGMAMSQVMCVDCRQRWASVSVTFRQGEFMSDIKMVDVTLHIDENIDHASREVMQDKLRALDGVVAAVSRDEKPHLLVVEYNPDRVNSDAILACVQEQGVHAELIGL